MNDQRRILTQDELVNELRQRFGDNPMDWAFRCPSCGDVATGKDFSEALAGTAHHASSRLGQECIGRSLGALSRSEEYTGRGCDWCAYGLLSGPWFVRLPDGKEIASFPIAYAAKGE